MKVKKITEEIGNAEAVADALDKAGVEFVTLDNVNWPESFPYKPEVKVRMGHTDSALLLNYEVKEESIRAMAPGDNGNVWEDSCVEFFIKKSDADKYFNIECNCAGTLLIAEGPDRNNRVHLPKEHLERVSRYSTNGTGVFEEREAPEKWQLSLVIPKDIIGIENKNIGSSEFKGNIYKCGDALKTPHFVSWQPIATATPDFHRPEFFGEIRFE